MLPPPLSLMEVIEKYSVDGVAPDLDELREEMADDLARPYGLDAASIPDSYLE